MSLWLLTLFDPVRRGTGGGCTGEPRRGDRDRKGEELLLGLNGCTGAREGLFGLIPANTGEGGTCRAGDRLAGVVKDGGIGGGLTILREGVEDDGGSCGRG